MKRYFLASLLILVSVVIAYYSPNKGSFFAIKTAKKTKLGAIDLEWRTLQKLNYKENKISDPTLQKSVNKVVKIPGFAVPLSDSLSRVQEFLIVPNQMACIHVPPPPPNLILYVKLAEEIDIENIFGPLWFQGTLRHKTVKSMYGSSSWELENVQIEPYSYADEE